MKKQVKLTGEKFTLNKIEELWNAIGRTCEMIKENDSNEKRNLETRWKLKNDILCYLMMYEEKRGEKNGAKTLGLLSS